jgi:hypothetical protein
MNPGLPGCPSPTDSDVKRNVSSSSSFKPFISPFISEAMNIKRTAHWFILRLIGKEEERKMSAYLYYF